MVAISQNKSSLWKYVVGAGLVVGVVAVVSISTNSIRGQIITRTSTDVPFPFPYAGSYKEVTYDNGEIVEPLVASGVHLVLTPTTGDMLSGATLREAMDLRGKRVYGYKYTSRSAVIEQSATGSFAQRFPGVFFASDSMLNAESSFIANFEAQNGVTFVHPEQVSLDRDAMYEVMVLDPGVSFRVRGPSGGSQTGNLYVTQSVTPLPPHQLLGGTLGEAVLRIKFRADEREAIDVTKVVLTATDPTAALIGPNVDRFELYRSGETAAFAYADVAGCGTEPVAAHSMCATMTGQQLVVPSASSVEVLVRPLMRTDVVGAVSSTFVTMTVDNMTGTAIRARGVSSSNVLSQNNGNGVAEGEVFLATDTPAPDGRIVGQRNQVVLSKLSAIVNANPDADGSAIPTGNERAIGQFKFMALDNSNASHGLNKWTLTDTIFTVDAENVAFDDDGFALYNKENTSEKARCSLLDSQSSDAQFFVACRNLPSPPTMGTEIDPGGSQTFVLEAFVTNPSVNAATGSRLQVSIDHFTDAAVEGFGVSLNHIHWLDKDSAPYPKDFFWVEHPETVVRSTMYGSGPSGPECGNGRIETYEQCDDGNALSYDGCSSVCIVEDGFTCTGEPSVCSRDNGLLLISVANSSPSRQLLGGTLGEGVLELRLVAQLAPAEVHTMRFLNTGNEAGTQSIDRLELYRAGETTPFGIATQGGCAGVTGFCARMGTGALVIPENEQATVVVRPRMKTDVVGAVSNGKIQITLVEANGTTYSIPGNRNVVVLSKVVSITNASPDASGSTIPSGSARAIGQFKFTAAENTNSKNGLNDVVIKGIIFNVNATNVQLGTGDNTSSGTSVFKFYNKADPSSVYTCTAAPTGYSGNGSSGALVVTCPNITLSAVNTEIDPGSEATFVLRADVTKARINDALASVLQVTLKSFNDINATLFGGWDSRSHIAWLDRDEGASTSFLWIENAQSVVESTYYKLEAPPPTVDLSIVKGGTASAPRTGTGVTYSLLVQNLGPTVARNVTVTDTFPAQLSFQGAGGSSGTECRLNSVGTTVTCTLGDLQPGIQNGRTIILSFVAPAVQPCTAVRVSNSATVTSQSVDTNPANNQSSFQTSLTCPPAPSPHATITDARATRTPSSWGKDTIVFTASIRNDGSVTIPNVSVLAVSCQRTTEYPGGFRASNAVAKSIAPLQTIDGVINGAYLISSTKTLTTTCVFTATINAGTVTSLTKTFTVAPPYSDDLTKAQFISARATYAAGTAGQDYYNVTLYTKVKNNHPTLPLRVSVRVVDSGWGNVSQVVTIPRGATIEIPVTLQNGLAGAPHTFNIHLQNGLGQGFETPHGQITAYVKLETQAPQLTFLSASAVQAAEPRRPGFTRVTLRATVRNTSATLGTLARISALEGQLGSQGRLILQPGTTGTVTLAPITVQNGWHTFTFRYLGNPQVTMGTLRVNANR